MHNAFEQKLKEIHQRNCKNLPAELMTAIQKTSSTLKANQIDQHSLQIGNTVADFHFDSTWCNAKSLYELLQTGPVVLSFYRGYWCSYCREEMAEYRKVIPQLLQAGQKRTPPVDIHYLAICPQQVIEHPVDFKQDHYIVDDQLKIAKQFGIVYEQPWEEQSAFANMGFSVANVNKMNTCLMTLPSLFIINQKGTITYRLVSTDYRQRQDPNEIPDLV